MYVRSMNSKPAGSVEDPYPSGVCHAEHNLVSFIPICFRVHRIPSSESFGGHFCSAEKGDEILKLLLCAAFLFVTFQL